MKLTRSLPQFHIEILCLLNLHYETLWTVSPVSFIIFEIFLCMWPLGYKRMLWEIMILSLYSMKLSFMWRLRQWPEQLTAFCLDVWPAGKMAGGRLRDKSKTDWGRTDNLPRTLLRGHVITDGTMSLNRSPVAPWENLMRSFTSHWNKHLNILNSQCCWYWIQCFLQKTKPCILCN